MYRDGYFQFLPLGISYCVSGMPHGSCSTQAIHFRITGTEHEPCGIPETPNESVHRDTNSACVDVFFSVFFRIFAKTERYGNHPNL